MLSLKEVKELVNDPKLSDEEIQEIRDGFHALAEVIFDQWNYEREISIKQNSEKPNNDTPKCIWAITLL